MMRPGLRANVDHVSPTGARRPIALTDRGIVAVLVVAALLGALWVSLSCTDAYRAVMVALSVG